ncbi:uncharacterized protein LOC129589488 [Paramacrobiotus metropolitanus]|uniref:uncharacterized protein LOC129589488 n=1 Tax=Paramacrobiotus metropolitanus TaxID=2943436 RepID=UPI002445D274|nr:uncharacterized protein LOC129589488 [Paramacrobiotus metropolitanus]
MPSGSGTAMLSGGRKEDTGGLMRFEPVMTWRSWQYRYKNYVALHKVTDTAEQKAVLLDALGVEALEILISMCLPGSPDDFTAGQLADKLEQVFVKKTLKETEWALYFRIKQEPGETLLEFSIDCAGRRLVVVPATVLEQNMMAAFTNGLVNETPGCT